MTKKIEYTKKALKDLRDIKEYISTELYNPVSAQRIIDKIAYRIDTLSDLPEIGAPLSARIGEKTDYRYLVCGNYNVFYRVEDKAVKIIRVLNARRNFMDILFGKEFKTK